MERIRYGAKHGVATTPSSSLVDGAHGQYGVRWRGHHRYISSALHFEWSEAYSFGIIGSEL